MLLFYEGFSRFTFGVPLASVYDKNSLLIWVKSKLNIEFSVAYSNALSSFKGSTISWLSGYNFTTKSLTLRIRPTEGEVYRHIRDPRDPAKAQAAAGQEVAERSVAVFGQASAEERRRPDDVSGQESKQRRGRHGRRRRRCGRCRRWTVSARVRDFRRGHHRESDVQGPTLENFFCQNWWQTFFWGGETGWLAFFNNGTF